MSAHKLLKLFFKYKRKQSFAYLNVSANSKNNNCRVHIPRHIPMYRDLDFRKNIIHIIVVINVYGEKKYTKESNKNLVENSHWRMFLWFHYIFAQTTIYINFRMDVCSFENKSFWFLHAFFVLMFMVLSQCFDRLVEYPWTSLWIRFLVCRCIIDKSKR